MNPGGDAAEQVVRLSLEGVEVAAKISGAGAKNIALLLYAALKEEQKTKGRAEDEGQGETDIHAEVRQRAQGLYDHE